MTDETLPEFYLSLGLRFWSQTDLPQQTFARSLLAGGISADEDSIRVKVIDLFDIVSDKDQLAKVISAAECFREAKSEASKKGFMMPWILVRSDYRNLVLQDRRSIHGIKATLDDALSTAEKPTSYVISGSVSGLELDVEYSSHCDIDKSESQLELKYYWQSDGPLSTKPYDVEFDEKLAELQSEDFSLSCADLAGFYRRLEQLLALWPDFERLFVTLRDCQIMSERAFC